MQAPLIRLDVAARNTFKRREGKREGEVALAYSRNFLIEEKKLYLNGPCKSVASLWRCRITYTAESCYANSRQRFAFPAGARSENDCSIPAKDSMAVRLFAHVQ